MTHHTHAFLLYAVRGPLRRSWRPSSNPMGNFNICVREKTFSMNATLSNVNFFFFDSCIKYCKVIKDKNNGESKGFAYAKYDKASSAALAIESLDGKKISDDQPAFKVFLSPQMLSLKLKYSLLT
jgi:RNA recognition motif-containing protein